MFDNPYEECISQIETHLMFLITRTKKTDPVERGALIDSLRLLMTSKILLNTEREYECSVI